MGRLLTKSNIEWNTGVRWHAVRHDGKRVSRKAEFMNNSGYMNKQDLPYNF
jgi:hypothetical protein